MAIIECPECEGKLSTSAKKCIHCGCEFTVCRECGTVLVGKPTVCPECGYAFVKKENDSDENEYQQEKNSNKSEKSVKKGKTQKGIFGLKEIYKNWRNESGINNLKIFKYVTMAISYICLAVAFIQFVTANQWGFEYKDKMTLMTAMLGVMCIMEICGYAIMNAGEFAFVLKISAWAKTKNIGFDTLTGQYLENLKKQYEDVNVIAELNVDGDLRNIFKSLMFADNYNTKNQFIGFEIFEMVLKAVSSGFIWSFVILNVRNITSTCFLVGHAKFFTEMFSFSSIEYWWLFITGIVVAVIKILYTVAVESREDTCLDKWFKKEYGEYFEKK